MGGWKFRIEETLRPGNRWLFEPNRRGEWRSEGRWKIGERGRRRGRNEFRLRRSELGLRRRGRLPRDEGLRDWLGCKWLFDCVRLRLCRLRLGGRQVGDWGKRRFPCADGLGLWFRLECLPG